MANLILLPKKSCELTPRRTLKTNLLTFYSYTVSKDYLLYSYGVELHYQSAILFNLK